MSSLSIQIFQIFNILSNLQANHLPLFLMIDNNQFSIFLNLAFFKISQKTLIICLHIVSQHHLTFVHLIILFSLIDAFLDFSSSRSLLLTLHIDFNQRKLAPKLLDFLSARLMLSQNIDKAFFLPFRLDDLLLLLSCFEKVF